MVWVSRGMFDTKVMVAPNSPIALAKPSTMPASTPGSASGSVTVANNRQGAAPSGLASCASQRAEAAEVQQQQVARHDRRQHQWQVDRGVEDCLTPKVPPRQQPRQRDAERR